MANMKKQIKVRVTEEHIEAAKCRDPNKCMIKMAVVDAIGKNCYCKVDMTGISITRRDDYRERAFLPRRAAEQLIRFDGKMPVKPFAFTIDFLKSTSIFQTSQEKRDRTNAARRRNAAKGIKKKNYGPSTRVAGIAVGREFAKAA